MQTGASRHASTKTLDFSFPADGIADDRGNARSNRFLARNIIPSQTDLGHARGRHGTSIQPQSRHKNQGIARKDQRPRPAPGWHISRLKLFPQQTGWPLQSQLESLGTLPSLEREDHSRHPCQPTTGDRKNTQTATPLRHLVIAQVRHGQLHCGNLWGARLGVGLRGKSQLAAVAPQLAASARPARGGLTPSAQLVQQSI
jgi:hypothetical protein